MVAGAAIVCAPTTAAIGDGGVPFISPDHSGNLVPANRSIRGLMRENGLVQFNGIELRRKPDDGLQRNGEPPPDDPSASVRAPATKRNRVMRRFSGKF